MKRGLGKRLVCRLSADFVVAACALVLAACSGTIGMDGDALEDAPAAPSVVALPLALAAGGGFADERGGGIFVDAAGRAVRLRLDGSLGRLESHPGNTRAPGVVQRVFPAGPFSALVVAEGGLYLAESGWLIEPSFRDALDPAGLRAVALDADGVTWLAHDAGLFRLDGGALAELRVAGESLTAIGALAAAPADDGSPAVWFARGREVGQVRQLGRARYEVVARGLGPAGLDGDVTALAASTPSARAAGELWLATATSVYRHGPRGWARHATPGAPQQLEAAGRFVWLRTAGALHRDAGDGAGFRPIDLTLSAQPPVLLAVDAGGGAWLGDGARTLLVGALGLPRLLGIFEGVRVYDAALRVRAQFVADGAPDEVRFTLDDGEPLVRTRDEALAGEGAVTTLDFALGGFDAAGSEQPFSIAALSDGPHTLRVSARRGDEVHERRLTFERRGAGTVALSFARDVEPIFARRCAACHTTGPGRALAGYAAFAADKAAIAQAVAEQRMPADGPLEPDERAIIQRWAEGSAAP